jgi:hypothetical protein
MTFFFSFSQKPHYIVVENSWGGHIFNIFGWCPGSFSFPFMQFKAPGPGKFFELSTMWKNFKMSWNLFLGNIFMKEWQVLRQICDPAGLYQWFENYTHIQNVLYESLISVLVTIFQFLVLRFGNRTGFSSRTVLRVSIYRCWVDRTNAVTKRL